MKKFTFFLSVIFFSGYILAQSSGVIVTSSPTTVTLDKADYLPGEIANISGRGFQAFEIVTLQVLHADGTPSTGDDHLPWTTPADANGDFQAAWHVCEDDCKGSVLQLTAQGQSSGLKAIANFSDATSFVFVGSFKVGDGPCWNLYIPIVFSLCKRSFKWN